MRSACGASEQPMISLRPHNQNADKPMSCKNDGRARDPPAEYVN
jgi:hypothetical protein